VSAASIIAKIAAWMAGAIFGHASITRVRSGSIGAFSAPTAAPGAAQSRESAFSSGFTGVACGLLIRRSQVRILPGVLGLRQLGFVFLAAEFLRGRFGPVAFFFAIGPTP